MPLPPACACHYVTITSPANRMAQGSGVAGSSVGWDDAQLLQPMYIYSLCVQQPHARCAAARCCALPPQAVSDWQQDPGPSGLQVCGPASLDKITVEAQVGAPSCSCCCGHA